MNKLTLSGRLTADAELRFTPSGFPVVNFCLAVWRGKVKEGYQTTDFIDVKLINKESESKLPFLTKGAEVEIDGKMQIDQYEKDGVKKKYPYALAFDVKPHEKEVKPEAPKAVDSVTGINLDDLAF